MIIFPDYIFIDDSTLEIIYLENILREEMSNGMAKTKVMQFSPIMNLFFEVSTHKGNLSKFNNWFRNEIRSGASFFLMRDPIDGEMRRYRFAETNISWKKDGTLFLSSFVLEAYGE